MRDNYCVVDNQTIRYWESGIEHKNKLLLLHGVGAAIDTWESQIPQLSSSFHVIAIDFPGFGKSAKLDIRYTLDFLTDMVQEFCSHLELNQIIIIGHSLGGAVALRYANTYPSKINKLVLIASAGFGEVSLWFRLLASPFSEKFILPFVGNDWLGPRIFRIFYGRGMSSQTCARLSSYWDDPGVIRTFVSIIRSFGRGMIFNDLSNIKCDSLIIWGSNDRILSVKHTHIAKEKLINSQVEIIHNAGHGVHTEESLMVNSLISGFLNQ